MAPYGGLEDITAFRRNYISLYYFDLTHDIIIIMSVRLCPSPVVKPTLSGYQSSNCKNRRLY